MMIQLINIISTLDLLYIWKTQSMLTFSVHLKQLNNNIPLHTVNVSYQEFDIHQSLQHINNSILIRNFPSGISDVKSGT